MPEVPEVKILILQNDLFQIFIYSYIYYWITFEVAAVKGGTKFSDCWVAISMIMCHNLLVYYI